MSPPSFNVIDESWIPVRRDAVDQDMLGLRRLFVEAATIEDIVVPVPPAAAGLWRILYAITARLTGLDDPTLTADQWNARRWEVARHGIDPRRVEEYFDRWASRFDLFHPQRPWLQDPRLAAQCTKRAGVNKLVFDRPSGNNQVWFGHFSDVDPVPVPSEEAAWYLVAQWYFGASGRCSARTVGGVSAGDTSAGPLRSAVSFHPLGRTVLESLLAGLPDTGTRRQQDAGVVDRCAWEFDELPNPLGQPWPATWPGGLLTARGRHAMLLVPSSDGRKVTDAYLTWAWRRPALPCRDPYVIMDRSKEGNLYHRRADRGRALWRDVDALVRYNDTTAGRPDVIDSCLRMPEPDELRVRSYGFDQDGQAKDHQWFTATTPRILKWLTVEDPYIPEAAAKVRARAERMEWRLREVLRQAWAAAWNLNPNEKRKTGPWPDRASAFYWPRAEELFWNLVEADNFDDPKHFLALAHRALDFAVGDQERLPKVAKAVHTARQHLTHPPKEKQKA